MYDVSTTLRPTEIVNLSFQTRIQPHHSGFGMFDVDASGPSLADGYALESDITANLTTVYQLGRDELPEGAEDIRGRIYNEPTQVYYYEEGDDCGYFGVNGIDTVCDVESGEAVAFADDNQLAGSLAERGYAMPN